MVAIEHCQISAVVTDTRTNPTSITIITPTNSSNSNNDLTTGGPSDILSPNTPTSPASSSTTISSTIATSVSTNVQQKLITSTSLKMSSMATAISNDNNNDSNDDDDVLHTKSTSDAKITTTTTTIKINDNTSKKSVLNVESENLTKPKNKKTTQQELSKKIMKLDLKAQQSQDIDENSIKSPKSPIAARLSHQTSLTSSVDVEDRKTLREALYQGIFSRHRRTIFAFGSFLRMLRSRSTQYNTIRSSSEGEDVDEVNSSR